MKKKNVKEKVENFYIFEGKAISGKKFWKLLKEKQEKDKKEWDQRKK